jgi:hypothetical protein
VEINLTDFREEVNETQKIETIMVYEGDRSKDLARNFVKQHSLNSKIESKLTSMLESHILKILPAINENENE